MLKEKGFLILKLKLNLSFKGLKMDGKKTDICLSFFGLTYGFFVSGKAKIILEKYELGMHEFFKTTISIKGNDDVFYFLLLRNNALKFIDFPRTKFSINKKFSDSIISGNNVTVKNIDEALVFNSKLGKEKKQLRFQKIYFKDWMNSDLFGIFSLSSYFFVSEGLKNELVKSNISGLSFDESQILA